MKHIDQMQRALDAILLPARRIEKWKSEAQSLLDAFSPDKTISEMKRYLQENPPSEKVMFFLIQEARRSISNKGGDATKEKHDKLKQAIQNKWATGIFSSRDICADQEFDALGFGSFKAARNALINTPDPDPWPAKKRPKHTRK